MTFDDLQVSDLAWIRAIAGLTQAQAAERLGISKSHYAGIEAGDLGFAVHTFYQKYLSVFTFFC